MDTLKPQIKARNVPLLQGIRGVTLSRLGAEAILKQSRIDSEGEIDRDVEGLSVYRGSTMLTVDVHRAPFGVQEETGDALLDAVRRSLHFRVHLMRLARREAERRSEPWLLTGMLIDSEFKIDGKELLVDINVECPLAMPKVRDGSGEEGRI